MTMTALVQTLRDLSAAVRTSSGEGRAAHLFDELKKKCIRHAQRGETSTSMYESLPDYTDEEVTDIGTEIVRLINKEEFTLVNYSDDKKTIDITVSWR